MDILLQEIGNRVRKARKDRGMTQSQLAEAADMSPSFLSNIETGHQAMNIRSLIALSNVLHVSADWLLNTQTETAVRAEAKEIEKELSACTPREREAILQMVLLMKQTLAALQASRSDE